jgi:hypothetical protein
MSTPDIAFEIMDVLGLTRLDKRRSDLDGSVPLRAVQGCGPLLEGNAAGFQVTLRQTIMLDRDLHGWHAHVAAPFSEALAASQGAALPRLLTQRLISPHGRLATDFPDRFVRTAADGCGLDLWTGLLVRPVKGTALRVSGTANRRNRLIEVDEHFIPDDGEFHPLLLRLTPRRGGPDRLAIEGEIATIIPVEPNARITDVTLRDAPEVGASHADFYNDAYFDAKARGVTRKYRRLRLPESSDATTPSTRIVNIGPSGHRIGGEVRRVDFTNLIAFDACFDGINVTVTPHQPSLQAATSLIERAFADALGLDILSEHRDAVRYFTTYFTTHPPGEPHFFVKPWALMETPPGWSCLIEGAHGDGYDIMRAVIATDVFHAIPAVFELFGTGAGISVAVGAPLFQAIPIPRRLLQAGYRELTLPA